MARPKKSDAEKRTTQVNLRLTDAEYASLRVAASTAGLSVSDFVRSRAMSYQLRSPRSSSVDPALVSELNRIGVNVNQLARAHHRDSAFVNYWREVGDELRGILSQVLSADGP